MARLRSTIRRASSKNVCAFNINDETEMRELIDLGVDAIMTDRPDMLARVVTPPVPTLPRAVAFA